MSLLSRLRNLWRLSAFDLKPEPKRESVIQLFGFSRRAKVVDMYDPLSIDLGEEDDKDNSDEA